MNASSLRVNKISSISEANTNDTNTIQLAVLSDTKNLFRELYSEKEEAAIIEFLLTAGGYNIVRGQRIWKEMEYASICPGRSAQALREYFLKHAMFKEVFKVIEEQLLDADKNSKHMKTLSSRSYVGGEYHGLRGFRPGAKYYIEEEDRVIMEFIINNGHEEVVGGNHVWKLMMERNFLEGRTWQSMKERFRKNILNRLDFFDLTPEQKMKLEKRKRKRRK